MCFPVCFLSSYFANEGRYAMVKMNLLGFVNWTISAWGLPMRVCSFLLLPKADLHQNLHSANLCVRIFITDICLEMQSFLFFFSFVVVVFPRNCSKCFVWNRSYTYCTGRVKSLNITLSLKEDSSCVYINNPNKIYTVVQLNHLHQRPPPKMA